MLGFESSRRVLSRRPLLNGAGRGPGPAAARCHAAGLSRGGWPPSRRLGVRRCWGSRRTWASCRSFSSPKRRARLPADSLPRMLKDFGTVTVSRGCLCRRSMAVIRRGLVSDGAGHPGSGGFRNSISSINWPPSGSGCDPLPLLRTVCRQRQRRCRSPARGEDPGRGQARRGLQEDVYPRDPGGGRGTVGPLARGASRLVADPPGMGSATWAGGP